MRTRLVMLIAAGFLMTGGLQLWLQFPNHFSNYLTRWEVQDYKQRTGTSSVPVPVDRTSRLWPKIVGAGSLLSGVALFAVGIRMYTRKRWLPLLSHLTVKHAVVIAILLALTIMALWRPTAVQYHRLAMRLWHAMPAPEWDRHQHALIKLGYFQEREFRLDQRILTNISDFMRCVDVAPFRDGQWEITPHADRVSVKAYGGDMRLWEDVVRGFDQADPDSP